MKVLFLISDANAHGGTEILAYNLLHELNAKGCECWLMSRWGYGGKDSRVVAMSKGWQRVYDFVEKFPLNKLCGLCFSDWILRRQICKMAARLGCDWVVSHTYDLIAAIPSNGFKTAQVFNWSIKGYEEGLRRSIKSKSKTVKGWMSRVAFEMISKRWHLALARMDKLVMLSSAAVQEMREYCPGVDFRRLIVIPDPIMAREPAKTVSSLRNKHIAFVGRLSHEKGVMRLLRIWGKVQEKLPEYTLDIYGDGHLRQAMLAEVEKVGGGGECRLNVVFRGFEKDLEKIYTGCDLLLMTSDTEGFGMVLIEAMYYGVPCVSFDCPVSPKEIIGAAGVTVPCFDEDAYAAEVVKLLGDETRLVACQCVAVVRAQDFYIEKIINRWVCEFFDGGSYAA